VADQARAKTTPSDAESSKKSDSKQDSSGRRNDVTDSKRVAPTANGTKDKKCQQELMRAARASTLQGQLQSLTYMYGM